MGTRISDRRRHLAAVTLIAMMLPGLTAFAEPAVDQDPVDDGAAGAAASTTDGDPLASDSPDESSDGLDGDGSSTATSNDVGTDLDADPAANVDGGEASGAPDGVDGDADVTDDDAGTEAFTEVVTSSSSAASTTDAEGDPDPQVVPLATGTVSLSRTEHHYSDTVERDVFDDVTGTITLTGGASVELVGPDGPAGPSDGARGDATITYTQMATSDLGRLYLGARGGGQEFLFAPDHDVINGLIDGQSAEVAFDFGGGATFTVTASGVNDRPILSLAARDDITASLPAIGGQGFVDCGTRAGSGWPYRLYNAVNASGYSPSGERCHFAFDGSTTTKYLNFGRAGSGVLIDSAQDHVVTGLHLTTANDSSERDPTSFHLRGSNSGFSGPWTDIASGPLTPPSARQTDFPDVAFGNAAPYRYYQLSFPTLRGPSENSMQVSRIRLSGALGSGPALYAVGGAPVAVEPDLDLWDDSAALAEAQVRLTAGAQAGDVLHLDVDPVTMGDLTSAWDASTRRLTLTGSATPGQYTAALRAVRFSTSSTSTVSRTVTWQVTDDASLSSTVESSAVVVVTELPPQPQSIAWTGPADQVYGDDPVTLVATATSGAPVVFSSQTPSVCRVEGNEVTSIDTGTCAVRGEVAAGGGYLAVSEQRQFLVTPRPVTIAGWHVPARPYDGTSTVTVTGTPTLLGRVDGDAVTVQGPTGATTATPAVGEDRGVTLTGVALAGPAAHRYQLTLPNLVTTIRPRTLTVSGVMATSRAFDGSRSVALTGATLTGVVAGDQVTLTGQTSGQAASAAAGTHPVTTVMKLAGTAAANYQLVQPTPQVTITKAPVTLSITGGLIHLGDGVPKGVTVATSPPGVAGVAVTYDGRSTRPSAPGIYPVRVVLDAPNHAASPVTATMVIAAPSAGGTTGGDGSGGPGPVLAPTPPPGPPPAIPPVFTPEGTPPPTGPGTAPVYEDGAHVASSVTVIEERTIQVDGDGYRLRIDGTDAERRPLPVDARGLLRLQRAGLVQVRGDGFDPGSYAEVWIFSTPRYLGSVLVGSDGSFEASLPLPSDLEIGDHTVQVNGRTQTGAVRSVSLGVVVEEAVAATDRPTSESGSSAWPTPSGASAAVSVDRPVAVTASRSVASADGLPRTGASSAQLAVLAALLLSLGASLTRGQRRRAGRTRR